jgi:UDPglucose--hexose-1-phosphate uridylyltransferase
LPELRKDPIVGRWVIISTDRAKRPTDFVREGVRIRGGFCPFCPGNESKTPPEIQAYRPNPNGGPPLLRDTPGWTVRVVPNKFPALGIEGNLNRQAEGMFDKMNGIGAHEVIIETPDHAATLANMSAKRIEDVLWTFRDRILDLKKDRRFKYILLFKNHGEPAGASLEHGHCQLIALPILPIYVQEEIQGAKQYYIYKERCVFCDLIRQGKRGGRARGCRERRLHYAGAVRAALPVRDLDPAQGARIGVRKFVVAHVPESGEGFEDAPDEGRPCAG